MVYFNCFYCVWYRDYNHGIVLNRIASISISIGWNSTKDGSIKLDSISTE